MQIVNSVISVVAATLLVAGCSNSNNGGEETPQGKHATTLVKQRAATPSECNNGGVSLEIGFDTTGDSKIDQITQTEVVCNGEDGTIGTDGEKGDAGSNGLNALIMTEALEAGVACALGGITVHSGLDANSNAVLEKSEITQSSNVCFASTYIPPINSKIPLNAMNFPLGKSIFSNGFVLEATWGLGSGATHKADDDAKTFYTMTDRGVNIKCKDDEDIIGMDICEKGKIFPFPEFSPSIVKFEIDGEYAIVKEVIAINDAAGKPISGVSNPISNFSEKAYDKEGNELTLDPNGIDSEAMVALSDGTFWLAEEYTSSILHVAADGKVIVRYVPAGLESEYSSATYLVEGKLPAIITKRHANRGIESIAISPDEKTLYFAMQSPLDNPDADAYKASSSVRLYKMPIADPSAIEEFLYVEDAPGTFLKDNESKTRKQSDVKISEMVALAEDDLLVLERVSATTKLYRVDLNATTPVNATQSANLELNTTGVIALSKKKVFDTDLETGYPNKLEGIAHLESDKFLLINDNDFGIEGADTVAKIATIDVDGSLDKKQTHGKVVFFKTDGTFLKSVNVGVLPDMVKYTHDGAKVLVANEGELVGNEDLDAPLYDPYGTVSIIDTADYGVSTIDFKSVMTAPSGTKIRSGAEVARDFEPEYIAVDENDTTAWVTLQESNAVAKIDLSTNTLVDVYGLGFKDFSQTENALDFKKDDTLNIETTPAGVYGMYQPDTIQSYTVGGTMYFVTANEGDDRDDFYEDMTKASKLPHTAIGDIGDLRVTPDLGKNEATGEYEALYAAGARSFSIWSEDGTLVYDSKNAFAQKVAADFPTQFNTRDKKGKWKGLDERSEKKGVEPEALALATIGAKTFAYIGLEKQGGFFVYDISNPTAPTQVEYFNDINYSVNSEDSNVSSTIDDIAPEGMVTFEQDSVNYLAVANEGSGTVSLYELNATSGKVSKKSTYYSGVYGESACEIVDYDAAGKRLFVTNANDARVDVLDVSNVNAISKTSSISITPYGTGINSVSVNGNMIAVAVEIKE